MQRAALVLSKKAMLIIQNHFHIAPYEVSMTATPEFEKLKALAAENEDLLRETLSDEQKELLEKFTECVTDISSVSEREMFVIGFRLGVKLMIDVMK